jgi:hypothetical protein
MLIVALPNNCIFISLESKNKAVPLLTVQVLRCERRYSAYSFLTSALDGAEWSASCPSHVLPPGKDSRYLLDRRLGGPQTWSGHRG